MGFEARLTEIDIDEVLLYLGYRGQDYDPELDDQIKQCMDKITAAAKPKLVYRRLPVLFEEAPVIDGLALEGRDMADLLTGCGEAVAFAATLGPDVESLMLRTEVVNVADALIMDACASASIEKVCNNFEADIREAVTAEGLYLTDRFSPGYGDLPLSVQRPLCELLNTQRRIGLTVSRNDLMMPRKSVTAIMGITEREPEHRPRGCESCVMFRKCEFRKNYSHCRGKAFREKV